MADLDPVEHGVGARSGIRLGADRVDGIGTAAMGEVLDAVVDVFLHEIDGDGARLFGERQASRDGIDGDDALGAEQEGTADRRIAQPGQQTEHHDGFATLDVTEFGAHVAGGEDVRQEQNLFIRQAVGDLDGADIGVGDTEIFGLAAGIATSRWE